MGVAPSRALKGHFKGRLKGRLEGHLKGGLRGHLKGRLKGSGAVLSLTSFCGKTHRSAVYAGVLRIKNGSLFLDGRNRAIQIENR